MNKQEEIKSKMGISEDEEPIDIKLSNELFKRFAQPDKWAMKEIMAGRMRGKTDINPMFRIQALTETYGLCGIGWYYEVVNKWIEPGADGEVSAFADVNLYIKVNDQWSKPIPGNGGSSFITTEKKGQPSQYLYTSDECFKMSITDALSVCCKMIGIGFNVYAGEKYQAPLPEQETSQPKEQPPQMKPPITDARLATALEKAKSDKTIYNAIEQFHLTPEQAMLVSKSKAQ